MEVIDVDTIEAAGTNAVANLTVIDLINEGEDYPSSEVLDLAKSIATTRSQSLEYQKEYQIPAFAVSDIAGICDLADPRYTNAHELIDKYLYQRLDSLLRQDAKELGAIIIPQELEVQESARTIGIVRKGASKTEKAVAKETKKEMEALMKKAEVKEQHSAAAVNKIIEDFNKVKAKVLGTSSKLNEEEKRLVEKAIGVLEDEIVGKARCNYGRTLEDPNLNMYAKFRKDTTNSTLVSRNMHMRVWEVHDEDIACTLASSSSTPAGESARRVRLSSRDCVSFGGPKYTEYILAKKVREYPYSGYASEKDLPFTPVIVNESEETISANAPLFYIRGISDGLLITPGGTASKEEQRLAVVEAKSRTRDRRPLPLSLCDEIQVCAYCLLHCTNQGYLVQFKQKEDPDGVEGQEKNRIAGNTQVLLDDQHHVEPGKVPRRLVERWWKDLPNCPSILSRLRAFRNSLITLRLDDEERKRWLLAGSFERNQMMEVYFPQMLLPTEEALRNTSERKERQEKLTKRKQSTKKGAVHADSRPVHLTDDNDAAVQEALRRSLEDFTANSSADANNQRDGGKRAASEEWGKECDKKSKKGY